MSDLIFTFSRQGAFNAIAHEAHVSADTNEELEQYAAAMLAAVQAYRKHTGDESPLTLRFYAKDGAWQTLLEPRPAPTED